MEKQKYRITTNGTWFRIEYERAKLSFFSTKKEWAVIPSGWLCCSTGFMDNHFPLKETAELALKKLNDIERATEGPWNPVE